MMKSREPVQPISKKANSDTQAFNHPPFLMWLHSTRYQKLYETTLNHQGSIQVRSNNKWRTKTDYRKLVQDVLPFFSHLLGFFV